MGDLIDFTLSNARRFYSSKGENLAVKGLILNEGRPSHLELKEPFVLTTMAGRKIK